MLARLALLLAVILLAVPAGAEPKPKTPKPVEAAEVCPSLHDVPIIPFWPEEELWPKCPVASPIASFAGRCLGKTKHCMKPCAAKKLRDTELVEESTFRYDKSGGLVAATQANYYKGKKTLESAFSATRDGAGHITSYTQGDLVTKFTYKQGRLVAEAHTDHGKPSEQRAYTYDAQHRLEKTTWTGSDGDGSDAYTYDADGHLATHTSAWSRGSNKLVFGYDKGRLVTIANDKSYRSTLTYDGDGRVSAESAGGDKYTYDGEGRLVSQVRAMSTGTYTTTYAYTCSDPR